MAVPGNGHFAHMGDERAVEVRIHGVSGSSAVESLGIEPTVRVAGDELAGFFRRRTLRQSQTVPGVPRAAFVWGNLTSGAASRALWLLLLPFMLVNVAYWMRPRRVSGRLRWSQKAADHTYDMLVRLIALTLTAQLTMVAAGISMDLVAWQCLARGGGCAAGQPWLGFLAALGNGQVLPGRLLAIGALGPLAVVAVLWWLSRRTWQTYEVRHQSEAEQSRTASLSDPAFWRGREVVERLRCAHVAVALCVIAALVHAPLLAHAAPARSAPVLLSVLTLLVLAAGAVVAVLPDSLAHRLHGTRVGKLLRAAAVVLVLAALGAALTGRPGWAASGPLPGFAPAVNSLLAVQGASLVALVLAAVVLYRGGAPATTAMWGTAGPATAAIGVFLGGVFSAALLFQIASWLGGCPFTGAGSRSCLAIRPPSAFAWMRLSYTLEVAVGLLLLAALGVVLWRRYRRARFSVAKDYGAEPNAPRTREIAAARALAAMTECVPVCLSVLTLPLIILLAFSGIAAGQWFPTAGLAAAGSWLGAASLVLLVWLGRSAYQERPTRRAIGVFWDIGTFWPRAAHPLAPPCYAERAVPQLAGRIAWLADNGTGVVLSGHSQGSVLAAAAVWQLPSRCRPRVALVTHGSPLNRLYARYFPAYFAPTALGDLRGRVAGWHNLWRCTDPIGGPIELPEGTVAGTEPLADPLSYGPVPGSMLYPEILGHSDYTADPAYSADIASAVRRVASTAAEERVPCQGDRRAGSGTTAYHGP